MIISKDEKAWAGPCSFCGKPATAMWHGADVVRLCQNCAGGTRDGEEYSPIGALIADALWERYEQAPTVVLKAELARRALRHVKVGFLHARQILLVRKGKL